MAQLGKCRSCSKSILWVKTVNGSKMPLDPEPRPDGNVVSGFDGRARFLRRDVRQCRVCGCSEYDACRDLAGACSWVEQDLCTGCVLRESRRYMSHFATCPFRDRHRKARARIETADAARISR